MLGFIGKGYPLFLVCWHSYYVFLLYGSKIVWLNITFWKNGRATLLVLYDLHHLCAELLNAFFIWPSHKFHHFSTSREQKGRNDLKRNYGNVCSRHFECNIIKLVSSRCIYFQHSGGVREQSHRRLFEVSLIHQIKHFTGCAKFT